MDGTIFISVFLLLTIIRLTKILTMSPESAPPAGDELLTIAAAFVHSVMISAFLIIVHSVLSLL